MIQSDFFSLGLIRFQIYPVLIKIFWIKFSFRFSDPFQSFVNSDSALIPFLTDWHLTKFLQIFRYFPPKYTSLSPPMFFHHRHLLIFGLILVTINIIIHGQWVLPKPPPLRIVQNSLSDKSRLRINRPSVSFDKCASNSTFFWQISYVEPPKKL